MDDDIKIGFTIPRERLQHILTTAFESGIGYWADPGESDDIKWYTATRDAQGNVTSITFQPARGVRTRTNCITVNVLADAIGRALTQGLIRGDDHDDRDGHYDAMMAVTRELRDEQDAFTADALVQYALFGKVVYG